MPGAERRPQVDPGGSGRDRLVRVALITSLAAAAAVPVLHFLAIFPLVQNIPKWDQWSMMPVWSAYFQGQPVLQHLTVPYNGHYNLVPRFIFFGLGLLTDWDVRWEVVLSYLAAVATLWILLLMLRESGRGFLLLAWLPALQVFSLKQYENYMSGYPFGQVLSQAAATLALYLLTRAELRRRQVVLAAGAAAIATFSWGAGLATWGVGLLALALRRPRYPVLLGLWVAASLGAALAVWLGAQEAGLAGGLSSAGLETILVALAVLGNPLTFAAFAEPWTAIWLGCLVGAGFLWSLGCVTFRGEWLLALRWGLLGSLALGSSLLIGLGRHRAGLGHSLASHYATAAYPLTLATLVLASACLAGVWRRRRASLRWLAAATCAALLVLATVQPALVSLRTLRVVRSWHGHMEDATHRLVQGTLTDEEIRRMFHPNPTLVRNGLHILRRHELAWFGETR